MKRQDLKRESQVGMGRSGSRPHFLIHINDNVSMLMNNWHGQLKIQTWFIFLCFSTSEGRKTRKCGIVSHSTQKALIDLILDESQVFFSCLTLGGCSLLLIAPIITLFMQLHNMLLHTHRKAEGFLYCWLASRDSSGWTVQCLPAWWRETTQDSKKKKKKT